MNLPSSWALGDTEVMETETLVARLLLFSGEVSHDE
jgi:hypothetical protein